MILQQCEGAYRAVSGSTNNKFSEILAFLDREALEGLLLSSLSGKKRRISEVIYEDAYHGGRYPREL